MACHLHTSIYWEEFGPKLDPLAIILAHAAVFKVLYAVDRAYGRLEKEALDIAKANLADTGNPTYTLKP